MQFSKSGLFVLGFVAISSLFSNLMLLHIVYVQQGNIDDMVAGLFALAS